MGGAHGSYACEVSWQFCSEVLYLSSERDYCQRENSGYQKFLASIRAGDLAAFRAAALEVRDAWPKP